MIRKDSAGERMGLSIQGGAGSPCVNMHDETDEGIFISKVCPLALFDIQAIINYRELYNDSYFLVLKITVKQDAIWFSEFKVMRVKYVTFSLLILKTYLLRTFF